MSRLARFEDMEAWQDARKLVKAVYEITGKGALGKDYGLKDQLRRAAVSVMSSIAEGFERGGDKEFRQFLYVGKASAGEVRSLRYVALDCGYMDVKAQRVLAEAASQLGRQIGGFIKYLDRSIQGSKIENRKTRI